MAKDPTPFTVTCSAGAEANGIANIMQTLLTTNFSNKPQLVKVARKMHHPVSVIHTDTDTECTLEFGADGIVIHNGITGEPTVGLYVSADQLRQLSKLKVKAGGLLPIGLVSPSGSKVLRQIVARQLVIKGLLSHSRASLHTLALVSLAD